MAATKKTAAGVTVALTPKELQSVTRVITKKPVTIALQVTLEDLTHPDETIIYFEMTPKEALHLRGVIIDTVAGKRGHVNKETAKQLTNAGQKVEAELKKVILSTLTPAKAKELLTPSIVKRFGSYDVETLHRLRAKAADVGKKKTVKKVTKKVAKKTAAKKGRVKKA